MIKNSNDLSKNNYYNKALHYNVKLDRIVSELDSYYQTLSSKLTEASTLLKEDCSLYQGITICTGEIKKEIDKCVDAINSMKNVSLKKARSKDSQLTNFTMQADISSNFRDGVL